MSRARSLVRQLEGKDLSAFNVAGGRAREGLIVRLHRLAGRWHVWSKGPEVGTWWLQPYDEEARTIGEAITKSPGRGDPVVKATYRGCIAVRTREVK